MSHDRSNKRTEFEFIHIYIIHIYYVYIQYSQVYLKVIKLIYYQKINGERKKLPRWDSNPRPLSQPAPVQTSS